MDIGCDLKKLKMRYDQVEKPDKPMQLKRSTSETLKKFYSKYQSNRDIFIEVRDVFDYIRRSGHRSLFFSKEENVINGKRVPCVRLVKAKRNYMSKDTGFYSSEAIVDVREHKAIKAVMSWAKSNASRRKNADSRPKKAE